MLCLIFSLFIINFFINMLFLWQLFLILIYFIFYNLILLFFESFMMILLAHLFSFILFHSRIIFWPKYWNTLTLMILRLFLLIMLRNVCLSCVLIVMLIVWYWRIIWSCHFLLLLIWLLVDIWTLLYFVLIISFTLTTKTYPSLQLSPPHSRQIIKLKILSIRILLFLLLFLL